MYTFGFLGCGNMGGALALAAAKAVPAGVHARGERGPAEMPAAWRSAIPTPPKPRR